MPWVLGLVLKAWQFRGISFGDASAKFPDQTEFQSWTVIPNQLREKISLIMKNWIWWWRQNWNGATTLFIWSTKLPSREPWQDKRAKNSYTQRKTDECFQRKTIGPCSIRDACSFLHTHATEDREDNVGWSGDTQEILIWSKHTLQYRKWRNKLAWKALNSLKASPVTKVKNSFV